MEKLRAVIVVAGIALGRNFLEEGRNKKRLGLERVVRDELIKRFGASGREV